MINNNQNPNYDESWGKPIHVYTRTQALEDGVLVDVTETAKEAGFKIPVAVTDAIWHDYIEWENVKNKKAIQNTEGRLWDVLSMLRFACNRFKNESEIMYRLYVVSRDRQAIQPNLVTLKAVIGGGDNGEPVITIMLPNED
ncbi:MAG TPA: DUF6573 family protein [Candidatus Babeliales bacterium]|nr:DUF6573 family protein [Candidatus Babeliales bacterium]